MASRNPMAARTARSASSSWRTGTPKTAMTASPMNFSTVPPCCSITFRAASKYRRITSRRLSGSSRSPSAVEPVTSQKSTVTVLRWAREGAVVFSDAPHPLQKAASSAFSRPQLLQLLKAWVRRVDVTMACGNDQSVVAKARRQRLDDRHRTVPAAGTPDSHAEGLTAAFRISLRRPEHQRLGAIDELTRDRILEDVCADGSVEARAGAEFGHPERVSHHADIHHPFGGGGHAELVAE